MKPRMTTAIQPTNRLTLGNYLGAIKNFVSNQDAYDCFLFVADLHAITVRHDPTQLRQQTINVLTTYIASGVKPESVTMFVQSHVSNHPELGWILNCHAYIGELQRMHQFKEKSSKQQHGVTVGLFDYPVLMAADILLYDTNVVPVGDDQKQHIELTRDIAERMNSVYGDDTFVIPKGIAPPIGARIMSLQDPTSKMSKSDTNPNATIFMDDSDDQIVKKFKRAVTDSDTVVTDEEDKPGIRNLLEIQAAITGKSRDTIVAEYSGKQYGHLKKDTADLVIATIGPIRDNAHRIAKNDLEFLAKYTDETAYKAIEVSSKTLNRVRSKIGFMERTRLVY
jgi:tryptophanyl-tRNA synthetase